MTRREEAEIVNAFNLLQGHGIYFSVPGWLDILTADQAVEHIKSHEED